MFNNAIIVLLVLVSLLVLSFILRRGTKKKLNYMIDMMEDDEVNFSFREGRIKGKSLNTALNRLRKIFEKERAALIEHELYYGLMLDKVQTGILVLDNKGKIYFTNKRAEELLGMVNMASIKQLKRIGNDIPQIFAEIVPGKELKAVFYNENTKKIILLSASYAALKGNNVKIVAFNDISSQLDENEAESWNKLTKVLTHEIMNTVTPIASLSEALSHVALTDNMDSNYKAGLQTIANSSRNLIKFMESYRNLAHVAAPVKKAFYVRDMVKDVMQLTAEECARNFVEAYFVEKEDDILLYADKSQISQILLNLVKNAVQAGATKIEISAEIDTLENVIINVSNNGAPISIKGREDIFIPFYTTKQDGTGIGLSISRQIMRLHNGTISLNRSDERITVFILHFK